MNRLASAAGSGWSLTYGYDGFGNLTDQSGTPYNIHIDGGYWWIEVAYPMHPIHDNDQIKHETLRQLLGVWDHIKNKCTHREAATNYGLGICGLLALQA